MSDYGFWNHIFNMNEIMGNFGEQLAKYYSKIMTDAFVLHDIMIDGAEGMTSQIDLLLIGTKGIYVIEVKNFPEAYIYGDGKKNRWYYYLGGKKYDIYSPLLQNRKHIIYLKEFLKELGDFPFFSVLLIICKDFKINNINEDKNNRDTVVCSSLPVMKRGIQLLAKDRDAVISDIQKKEIHDFILKNQYEGKLVRATHKERIKEMNKKREELIGTNICPYCKKELVLWKGKYGDFYGCVNYPKCKYTRKL